MPKCKEIRVLAMQRSGHHAIIDWIIRSNNVSTFFLNNITRTKYKKQFETYNFEAKNIEEAVGFKKDLFIYNIEEPSLKKIKEYSRVASKYNLPLGETKNVIIIRDPYNLFASRAKYGRFGERWVGAEAIEMWKSFAREYVGETNFIKEKTFILYDDWYSSLAYRIMANNRLNCFGKLSKEIGEITKYGKGSSFSKMNIKNHKNLKVLERWRELARNEEYLKIFEDEELVKLSSKIFGKKEVRI